MDGEIRERICPWQDDDNMQVIAIWYGEPLNRWAIEASSNDTTGDLRYMTPEQAAALGHALIDIAAARAKSP